MAKRFGSSPVSARFFFILILLLSSILDLGERIRSVGVPSEIAFYVLSALLFYLLILRPILAILFNPTFSIDSLFERDGEREEELPDVPPRRQEHRRPRLSVGHAEGSDRELAVRSDASETDAFGGLRRNDQEGSEQGHREPCGDRVPLDRDLAKRPSRSGRGARHQPSADQGTRPPLRLRPSYASLGRLSVNVMSTAIIAETLEGIDFNELFPIAGHGSALRSAASRNRHRFACPRGVGSALLSLRVGIICRNYLFMNLKGQTKKGVRKLAARRGRAPASGRSRRIAAGKLPSRIKSMFKKKPPNGVVWIALSRPLCYNNGRVYIFGGIT
ncbi:MAG: hypothetical protein MZU79_05830 [Anaerotruncus sp.]|nr:hypothetical protein [Anaerotruncus sp.]